MLMRIFIVIACTVSLCICIVHSWTNAVCFTLTHLITSLDFNLSF